MWKVCVVLLGLFALSNSQTWLVTYQTSNFQNYQDYFQLNGDAASLNPNSEGLSLTYDDSSSGGSAFLETSIPLSSGNNFLGSFSTTFSFRMANDGGCGDEDGPGADGIVFIINSLTNQVGVSGGGMGYQGLPQSVGIEFDSYDNGYPTDNDGNHVGIDINGDMASYTAAYWPTRWNDGNEHWAWVDYNGETQLLEVRVSDDSNRPDDAYISANIDLPSILQSADVYVGFSAATGACYEPHVITSWTFTNTYAPIVTPPPQPVCGNGITETGEQCDGGQCCLSDCTYSQALCRASTGPCDAEEYCNNYYECPADVVSPSSVVCRASVSICDVAETCDGSSGTCPPDNFAAPNTVCRTSNGPCDVAEQCTGQSNACPADSFQSSSVVCRNANGVCDVAESCSGNSAACPADSFASSSVTCRSASGACDVAETCSGSSPSCPTDEFASSATVCRAAVSNCDVDERCSGSSSSCPADAFVASGVTCRPSTGPCDVQESCTGVSNSCPSDSFLSSSTVCRPSAGDCDVQEQCNGHSGECPADAFQSSSTVCRNSNGVCDVAESCSGNSAACPADAFASSSLTCRSASGVCDVAETCSGSSASCPADEFASSATVCRAAVSNCDVDEQCSGSSSDCPADAFVASGVSCRPSAGPCDVQESCTGTSNACPSDSFSSSSTVCRPSAGDCDVQESCSGSGASCPPDAFLPSSVVCRPQNGTCDVQETCTSWSANCPADSLAPSTQTCRPALTRCDVAENCDGVSHFCPNDHSGSFESACAGLNFNIDGNALSFVDFDVISFANFNGSKTGASAGRIAARNSVVLGNGYSVGAGIDTSGTGTDRTTPYALIAGGNVNWGSGSIYASEGMYVGGSFTGAPYLNQSVIGTPCATPNCLDSFFNAAQSCYSGYSAKFAAVPTNVNKTIQWSGLYISCYGPADVYSFSLTPAEMSQYTFTVLSSCNAQARWIINVIGTGKVNFQGGSFPANNYNDVIWNVVGSGRTINVNNIEVVGNILAPTNFLNQPSGKIDGKVIVGNVLYSSNILKGTCADSVNNS